ncbi:MAG: pilus assembly protein PilM [Gammaproteobacteria bacterium]|nr:pilus assembly protein PilM [Gammaproteobacteria bacterium]
MKEKTGFSAVVPNQAGIGFADMNLSGETPILNVCEFILWQAGEYNKKFLQSKAKQFGLATKPCSTVMALGDYSVLSVEAPDVPEEELRAAIRWQIKDLIDFHIDDAVIDIFDAPPSGIDGRQRSLYVVASKMSIVKAQVTALQEAEVNLVTIDVPELVLRNISRYLPEDQEGVAFVYLSKQQGLVVLTRQSTLYLARTLDIGTEFLQQADIEPLSFDKSAQNTQYDRLTLEVQRSIDYYDRYFTLPPLKGIVLAPMGVDIPGLVDYLALNLGLGCRVLDINEIVDSKVPLGILQQANCLMAIGAALRQEKKRF